MTSDSPETNAFDETDTFDVVVLGGGPVGEVAADRVVRGGLTAALVEAERFGGECSYWACMPSKALLRPVDLVAAARRVPGVPTGPLDAQQVLARRDAFTHDWDDSSQAKWVEGAGITGIRGHGRLTGEKQVEVTPTEGGVRRLTARHAVVVATGTTALVPDLPGLHDVRPWTSREVTSMKAVPRSLVVLGGGVVACEMAQAVKGLGAEQVTMIVRGDRLLERMEPWAGELVAEGLAETGVTVRFRTSATQFRRDGDGVHVTLDDGEVLVAAEVLVAFGRSTATTDLGLDTVGLTPGEPVEVDDSMRATGLDGGWLYAAGDANGRALLTHMGKYQARVAGDVIAARAHGEPDDRPSMRATGPVTQVTFTDPQAASVGLTEQQARDARHDVHVVTYELGNVAGASLLADDYRGRAALVLDGEGPGATIVGATFVGQEVAELLHSATVAITAGLTLGALWHAVPSYPTASEVWLRLLETAGL